MQNVIEERPYVIQEVNRILDKEVANRINLVGSLPGACLRRVKSLDSKLSMIGKQIDTSYLTLELSKSITVFDQDRTRLVLLLDGLQHVEVVDQKQIMLNAVNNINTAINRPYNCSFDETVGLLASLVESIERFRLLIEGADKDTVH
ncbi:hypothetical protein GCM10007916_11580 [Psychromonas marina]|uniref:Uncharacterized protein n=1 Tax=Psychromonas marina TaxID=88364 RepID=A0ABQ6DZA3_9GAMM|nr:hypothetical protein [Psychromonas marina]GLS90091.1 hypothetical protein GCM10007916_11580 [Psychromonas marina]